MGTEAITWSITGSMSDALMLDLFFNINSRTLQTSVSLVAKFVAFLRIYLATSKKRRVLTVHFRVRLA